MTVTAHRRRAIWLRAGVVASFVLGTILGFGAPALAAVTTITAPGSLTVRQNESVDLNYSVAVDTPGKVNRITVDADGLQCSGADCDKSNWDFPDTSAQNFKVTLKAGTIAPGTYQVTISATDAPNKTVNVTVQPAAPTTVAEISGTVKDTTTGEKLSDVLVVMGDQANHTYQDTTDGSGAFSFKSTASQPINAGTIRIAVSKDGFSAPIKAYTVAAGQKKSDISIAMTPKGAPTPSAQPSIEESPLASEDPAAGASTDASASTDGTGALDNTSGNQSDSGGLSWMMIIVGGLLVLLGIGAIALIVMRRNNDDDDDDEDEDDEPVRRPQGPRVTTGYYGARPSTDPTMVARSPMADSPTTVQRPGEYGARPQQPTGWTGYGQDAKPTYGTPGGGTYGSPVAPTSGYAGGAGAYGQQGGYGSPVAPTSGYGQGQASGPAYGQTSGPAYGQQHNGYGQQGSGYGQQQPGGYDQGGYGQQQGGGYGANGYGGQQGGYGQNGYGQQQPGGYDQGGYGQQQPGGGYVPDQRGGGYDQGSYGEPTQRWNGGGDSYGQQPGGGYDDQSRGRSDRRLDWLDD